MTPEQYATARPYPHCVIDHFLDDSILLSAADAFPHPSWGGWQTFNNDLERKHGFDHAEGFPAVKRVVDELRTPAFLEWLSWLTGIPDLTADLAGGGMHMIRPGGLLGLHTDNNRGLNGQWRRLNLLLFLNQDWQEEWGGHLELWNEDLSESAKIAPVLGRLAVFSLGEHTWHGHPHPLVCPPDRCRKSIAVYCYSPQRPDDYSDADHSTVFVPG